MYWKMKRCLKWTIIIFFICLIFPFKYIQASPEQHTALVIGNGTYPTGGLKNPLNDADDIADMLEKLGFDVMSHKDAGQRQMEDAIQAFYRRLQKGGVGLFYFAGHGVQVQGHNYLIPVDARIESESDVRFEAVDAGRVLGKMEDAGNPVNIVILDACRDNPFTRSFRTKARGLTRMDAPTGSFIAFATAPGATAADGEGRNGTFTKYLLRHMGKKGLTINQILMHTRKNVIAQTNRKQVPWESSSLTSDFYFVPKGSNTAVVQTVTPETIPLPEEDQISFEDLQKAAEAKRKAVQKWNQWQQERQHAYLKVKDLDKNDYLTPEQKIVAWQRFIAAVSQDNPYSEEDDKMRSSSWSRLSHWKSVQPKPKAEMPKDSPGADDNVTARDGVFVAYANGVVYD